MYIKYIINKYDLGFDPFLTRLNLGFANQEKFLLFKSFLAQFINIGTYSDIEDNFSLPNNNAFTFNIPGANRAINLIFPDNFSLKLFNVPAPRTFRT